MTSSAATAVKLRDLGFRWDACGKRGTVSFHWDTALLPPSAVDYVVVHPSARFFALVRKALVDGGHAV